jgi:hypothetical protein
VFCSLSLQPIVPEPNGNYGHHTLLFGRDTTKHRSTYNFGDKQQPRRSMLLLLDDIFNEHEKKDGEPGQSAKDRTKPADDLFRRNDNVVSHRALTLQEQWDKTLLEAPIPYPKGDLLIECQIWGPLTMSADMQGLVTIIDTQDGLDNLPDDWFKTKTTDVAARQLHLTTHYAGRLLAYAPRLHDAKLTTCQRPKPDDIHPEDREGILNKKASDHATEP